MSCSVSAIFLQSLSESPLCENFSTVFHDKGTSVWKNNDISGNFDEFKKKKRKKKERGKKKEEKRKREKERGKKKEGKRKREKERGKKKEGKRKRGKKGGEGKKKRNYFGISFRTRNPHPLFGVAKTSTSAYCCFWNLTKMTFCCCLFVFVYVCLFNFSTFGFGSNRRKDIFWGCIQ